MENQGPELSHIWRTQFSQVIPWGSTVFALFQDLTYTNVRVGAKGSLPQNMPFWYIEYFGIKLHKKEPAQGEPTDTPVPHFIS